MDIKDFFEKAIEEKASDLHLVAGSVPALRINGDLVKIGEKEIKNDELMSALLEIISKKHFEKLEKDKELDIAKEFENNRFRLNLHFQEGKIGLTARLIPDKAPSPDSIGFDETVYNLTHLHDGLILVTGPSGSGKSTTLASMINIINKERRSHIITIEDPIEYLFKEEQSIIEQREIGEDTNNFATALKYALRQDPNIIMVGEMRDKETMQAAIAAAETGHLVLSTLHTSTAADTVARIIDLFPDSGKQQILNQIAASLRAVIAQQMLPSVDKGRVVAREIMINNSAISNLIRSNQMSQIKNVIQTSQKEGMITMNKAIDSLLQKGIISESVAKNRKRDLETQAVYY
jgi:twitching motility protein PilT